MVGADYSYGAPYLQKFRLYETLSNFYMIGRDKNRTYWRVLKIDRTEPLELNIHEDPTIYSEFECYELLKRIHEGNRSTGGLKFVTNCYGIVGFVKLLGPYYMLLITQRRKIGTICGHAVYSIAKSEMIPIPSSTVLSNMTFSKNENRYKKLLLRHVDLTKDFFFSYSYLIMLSLQKNLSNHESGLVLYETMFVWNEFLTREIRNQLKNTMWTVALVYGFFKEVTLSVCEKDFKFILIARRSRHYAGTRYLKRGVNEKGRVANDVETEQIVVENVPEGYPVQISSIVQNRGSIPLFWSQETSRLNIKPDIILSRKDPRYEATKLHFENLINRYGSPIIILNLIKTLEKKPRESILRTEFANAIDSINKKFSEENHLKFLHWDLNKFTKNKATSVLMALNKVSANALELTGFFYCQVTPASRTAELLNLPCARMQCSNKGNGDGAEKDHHNAVRDTDCLETGSNCSTDDLHGVQSIKCPTFQRGVLRTNCIDCLDRTNVAQYAYGLVGLGHQLHALGFIDVENIALGSLLADSLMKIYEEMGDTLALQYGGSAAHNKIFSERRGQWRAATQSQEVFRTIQRYYSNAYMDAEKQDAINVFLGYFLPLDGKPALWELDSDQFGRHSLAFGSLRSRIKRSFSDGNIICPTNLPVEDASNEQQAAYEPPLPVESTPDVSTCESGMSHSRCTPSMSGRELFSESQAEQSLERGDSNFSNFVDVEWLSSSGNSCEEETYERSSIVGSPSSGLSSEGGIGCASKAETSLHAYDSGFSIKTTGDLNFEMAQEMQRRGEFSDKFVHWVTFGDMLFP
nr:phosphoinositide phosphatase SAC2-like isoform X1 [Ipomoea batatas]